MIKTGLEGVIYTKKVIADELKRDIGDVKIHGTHAIILTTTYTAFKNYAISGMDSNLRSTVKPVQKIRNGQKTEKLVVMQDMLFNILFDTGKYIIPVTLKAVIGVPPSRQDELTLHHSEFFDTVMPGHITQDHRNKVRRDVDSLILKHGQDIRDNLLSCITMEHLTEDGEYISVMRNNRSTMPAVKRVREANPPGA